VATAATASSDAAHASHVVSRPVDDRPDVSAGPAAVTRRCLPDGEAENWLPRMGGSVGRTAHSDHPA